ncbi:MAG: DUF4384 domain-containing protein [Gemmatimonadales bacterium]
MLMLLATIASATMLSDSIPVASAAALAPAIQITLNDDGSFMPGSPVRVRVQTRDDGYLIVFRVDGDGLVRVLFPLDPNDDAFVRGNKQYELQDRDHQEAFLADDLAGNGMVYAAVSAQPYQFADFVGNGHWDYGAIALRDSTNDAETELSGIVARMTAGRHFDYDAVGYTVQQIAEAPSVAGGGGYYPGYYDPFYNPAWRCLGCGWGYPGADFSLGLSFGYSPFYDPWFYSPWGYNYGYYSGGSYGFPGTYPVFVGGRSYRRPAPVGRPRPRPDSRGASGFVGSRGAGRTAPDVRGANPQSRGGNPGTRARPRPNDMNLVPRTAVPQSRQWQRPVFRQPPTSASGAQPPFDRGRPGVSARPVYREPPHVNRAPSSSPSYRPSGPPPSGRPSASPQRSAPSAPRARPARSGGGRGGHGGRRG